MASSATIVAMVGVLLLSLLGLSQGDMDPGVTAQTTIRQEICSGVDADNIKRDVDGVLHDEPHLTREMYVLKSPSSTMYTTQ